jgi:hypothetical protein
MNKLKTKIFILNFILLGLVLTPSILWAESEIILQESDIEMELTPENPEPYSNVTIKMVSYATDLNKAFIEWRSGSSVLLSGYGKTSYSFKTLGPNTATVFDIIVTPPDSINSISKTVSIAPSEVEVLWESIGGYVPPFYKGKTLFSREGLVKVVAIPNTNVVKQGKGNVTYTWKQGDKTNQNASGFNKDSFTVRNESLNKTEEISVYASSVDSNYNAIKTITIPTFSPKIVFYKKSPTEGVLYNYALNDNDFMTEDEMTIVGEPYFLSLVGNEYNFSYDWSINGQPIKAPVKKREITVSPSSRGGYATISLEMENLKTLYQNVSATLKLTL